MIDSGTNSRIDHPSIFLSHSTRRFSYYIDYGESARELRDRFTRQTASIRAAITNLEKQIAPNDLCVTALHFRDVVRADPMPDSDQALFTFPFRYAVCTYALSL